MIDKAKNRKYASSLGDIGRFQGVSHVIARSILKTNGVDYKKYKKCLKIISEGNQNRLLFAQNMLNHEKDSEFMFISDECSFGLIYISQTRY